MKLRRRHWWLRRMALGLAFASFAAPAAAQPDASTGPMATVDPYLTDVFVRPGEALSGPDGGAVVADVGAASAVQAHDAAPAPADSGWAVSGDAVALGLGALALALALGLAVGYARRPRIAGL